MNQKEYTICVPVYNELRSLPRLTKWLENNAKDANKIIFCSDGSTDGSNKYMREYVDNHPELPNKLFLQKNRMGKTHAMNFMIEKTETDVIIFLDADILPTKETIPNLLGHFKDKNVGCVCGYHIVLNPLNSIIDYLSHIIFNAKRLIDQYSSSKGDFFHVNGMICAMRKSAMPKIDYHGASQDAYLGWYIYRRGYKIIYADNVGINFYAPRTIRDYKKSRKRTILGRIRLFKEFNVQKYIYSEIPFPNYVIAILKSTPIRFKWILALIFGIGLEMLMRARYSLNYTTYQSKYHHSHWEQIKSSKW